MGTATNTTNQYGDDARINILGVLVDPVKVGALHEHIAQQIREHKHSLVLNVNVHCLNLIFRVDWLRPFLNSASLVFCDGAGVKLGAKLLGQNIPERITYADWMWQLAEFAQAQGYSLYLLGGAPNVAQQAADRFLARYPELKIVGIHHGYFDKSPGSSENLAVVEAINAAVPNILVVAFGMPLQEQWLMENWDHVHANVALTGGAVFDYVSGNLRRAPQWMLDNSLEWLGRMIIEPQRLWKRYVVGNPVFLWRVLMQRLRIVVYPGPNSGSST